MDEAAVYILRRTGMPPLRIKARRLASKSCPLLEAGRTLRLDLYDRGTAGHAFALISLREQADSGDDDLVEALPDYAIAGTASWTDDLTSAIMEQTFAPPPATPEPMTAQDGQHQAELTTNAALSRLARRVHELHTRRALSELVTACLPPKLHGTSPAEAPAGR
ncbi:MAG: hypothetical protein AAFQ88_06480 [Pseudomonadota bacterium]